jgi:hypothetical protein
MAEDSRYSEIAINPSDKRPHFEQDTCSTLETTPESYSTLEVAEHSTLEVCKRASELQPPTYDDHSVTANKGDQVT